MLICKTFICLILLEHEKCFRSCHRLKGLMLKFLEVKRKGIIFNFLKKRSGSKDSFAILQKLYELWSDEARTP